RVFASRQPGFRLDAAANGVRMGGELGHGGGRVRLVVDLDGGSDHWGRQLNIQVLAQDAIVPRVIWAQPVRIPSEDQPPIHFDVELAADETRWLVIRVSDPDLAGPGDAAAVPGSFGTALAYASPFFVSPLARPNA